MPSIIRNLAVLLGAGLLMSCSAPAQTQPESQVQPQPLPAVKVLPSQALAGKKVAVLPLTLLVADPAIQGDPGYDRYKDRRGGLNRADSLIGKAVVGRGPEVHWVLPPELRKIARRAAGFVSDPDDMGQAVLRAPKLETIPDPLRSSLRSLLAISDGRLALVPAALGFGPEPDGQIRADLSLVVADARTGKVMWRSLASGRGKTPDDALNAALAAVLPFGGT